MTRIEEDSLAPFLNDPDLQQLAFLERLSDLADYQVGAGVSFALMERFPGGSIRYDVIRRLDYFGLATVSNMRYHKAFIDGYFGGESGLARLTEPVITAYNRFSISFCIGVLGAVLIN